MSASRSIIGHGAQLVAALVVTATYAQSVRRLAPQRVDARTISAQLEVLPRHNQWSLVEPELRPALEAATRLSTRERERLVRSDDPRERGIGIFVTEQQGDLAALLACADLLDDHALTCPYAANTAAVGQYARHEQTVSQYLTATYLEWFGVDIDGSPARFKRLFGEDLDPEHLVRPWIVRLQRARDSAALTTRIKRQIEMLPDEVRWAVVTLAYQSSLYTAEQARGVLATLARPTRAAILDGAELLPEEPLFLTNDGTWRRVALEECRKLLNPPRP